MKQAFTGLLVFVCCVLVSQGHTTNDEPQQPAEWILSIKSWGAPWEKKFDVQLDQSGSLSFVEEDSLQLPKDPVTKLTRKISEKDLGQIYQQALLSMQNLRTKDLADGTWITLKLTDDRKVMTASYHVGQLQEEAPEVAKLFALINKHLPKEHQVY